MFGVVSLCFTILFLFFIKFLCNDSDAYHERNYGVRLKLDPFQLS